jgi:hypothetical protein
MKQTAVEFLEEQMLLTSPSVYRLMKENGDWQQAKAMEKEQIEIAYKEGWDCPHGEGFPETGEQYYKETYGK